MPTHARHLQHYSNVHGGAKTSRRRGHETEMLVTRVAMAHLRQGVPQRAIGLPKARKGGPEVTIGAHGKQFEVVRLIDPRIQARLSAVKDATRVWPMAPNASGQKDRGVGFLEKDTSAVELFFLLVAHTTRHRRVALRPAERRIRSLQVVILQASKSACQQAFDLPAFVDRASSRHAKAAQVPRRSDLNGHNMISSGVDAQPGYLGDVPVHWVDRALVVTVEPSADHGLEYVCEGRVAIVAPRDDAQRLDHLVAGVVNP
mmetsp:Transcript_34897/g.96314  ORF Transcript_34897/g.96314 Transcript_34897/m.96314 type:complete len:259 (-) Transcript_34897:902-1678(-)